MPLSVTVAGIPDGDLEATGVALGKQSAGSSPPSKRHLCSPSLERRVGVVVLLPAGVALAQSCLQPFYCNGGRTLLSNSTPLLEEMAYKVFF